MGLGGGGEVEVPDQQFICVSWSGSGVSGDGSGGSRNGSGEAREGSREAGEGWPEGLRNCDSCRSSAYFLWEDRYVRVDVISAGSAWGRVGCLKSILIVEGRNRSSRGSFADSPFNRRDRRVAADKKV